MTRLILILLMLSIGLSKANPPITIKSGDQLTLKISSNDLNSIRLPFNNPIVDSAANLTLKVRNNNILLIPDSNKDFVILISDPLNQDFILTLLLKPSKTISQSYSLEFAPQAPVTLSYPQQLARELLDSITTPNSHSNSLILNDFARCLNQAWGNNNLKIVTQVIKEKYYALGVIDQSSNSPFTIQKINKILQNHDLNSCQLAPLVAWTISPTNPQQWWLLFKLDNRVDHE